MFHRLLLKNNPRGNQVVKKNPRTSLWEQHPAWGGGGSLILNWDPGALRGDGPRRTLREAAARAVLNATNSCPSERKLCQFFTKSLLQLFSHDFIGFFIARCCPILLLVAGSDQDTVRFSVCASVWIFHAGRGGERGRSRNEKYMLQESQGREFVPLAHFIVCSYLV